MTDANARNIVVRHHPVRGALWGILIGTGATLQLLNVAIVPSGAWPLLAAPIAGAMILGIVWGRYGRPRRAKDLSLAELSRPSPKREPRSAANIRNAQLLAARAANEELHNLAAANTAMTAALLEAETDVLNSMRVRVISPVAQPVQEPKPAATVADAEERAEGSLSSVLATAEAPPQDDGPLSLSAPLPTADFVATDVASDPLVIDPLVIDPLVIDAVVIDRVALSPFEITLLPDEEGEGAGVSELEIQLEAALSAAMAVTTGAR